LRSGLAEGMTTIAVNPGGDQNWAIGLLKRLIHESIGNRGIGSHPLNGALSPQPAPSFTPKYLPIPWCDRLTLTPLVSSYLSFDPLPELKKATIVFEMFSRFTLRFRGFRGVRSGTLERRAT
jgi:hypothetical protein